MNASSRSSSRRRPMARSTALKRAALVAATTCAAAPASTGAFVVAPHATHRPPRPINVGRLPTNTATARGDDSDSDGFSPSRPRPAGGKDPDDDGLLDLAPPPINWERRSLLFDEAAGGDADVSTEADRDALEGALRRASGAAGGASLALWRGASAVLPGIVTGFWGDRNGDNEEAVAVAAAADGATAAGRLYNVLFVRVPTIAAGLVYARNLLLGHPLVVDVGGGPFEVPPPVVAVALWVILRF